MIEPALKDSALLADIDSAPEGELHIWWLGQSGFLVKYGSLKIIFDPYLSDSLTRKYADTDKPHVRMTGPVISPEQLTGIHLVTSTHAHTDHLDAETLQGLRQANPTLKLVHPAAIEKTVKERTGDWGEDLIGMDDSMTQKTDLLTVHAVAAAHNTVDRDTEGQCLFLGYVIQVGPWTIYHSGDTLWHDSLAESLEPFDIDVAILPINGNKPERRVAGNLDGEEAARLAHRIGAGCVLPCHYEMFEFNTASPELFRESCDSLNQPFRIPRAGERVTFAPTP